jgi:hypothetical protein
MVKLELMLNNLFENNGAEFSQDRKYRYCLWRIWDESKPMVMFIGLNPSTAKEDKNDNTITKLVKITMNNGFGGFYMMNLFAIVSPHPEILTSGVDALGDNDGWLEKIAPKCNKIVFAWGNFKEASERSLKVMEMFKGAYCLFQNKNGSPKHPLYCKDETVLIPFNKKLTY